MPDFSVDTGGEDDITAASNAMTGAASSANQRSGGAGMSATKSLAALWFACLALLWGLGYVFRRQLS